MLETDVFYHVAVTYDGSLLALYLNGKLQSYKVLTGKIRSTTYPFLMGQMLPAQPEYNFKGVLDAVKIFDYALVPEAVKTMFEQGVSGVKNPLSEMAQGVTLSPNPVKDVLTIAIPEDMVQSRHDASSLQILDPFGRVVLERKGICGVAVDLDLRKVDAGAYVVVILTENGRLVRHFVKI